MRLNEQQKNYLKDIFLKGLEKNNRKAQPSEVAKKMRYALKDPNNSEEPQLLFKRSEWLSEDRIKSFFSRLAAQKRFNLKDPEAATESQVDDAGADLVLAESVQQQIDTQFNYENAEMYEHPIQAAGIDICNLVKSAVVAKKLAHSDVYNYSMNDLRKALEAIGISTVKGKNRSNVVQLLKKYVNENCDCMTAFID